MQDGGVGDMIPPRDTKNGAKASEMKCIEPVFLAAVCASRLDGQNRRISYLYLYLIELRDDDNSWRSENQVMLFASFSQKNKYCVHTSYIVMYSFRRSLFFFSLSIHLCLLIQSFSTHAVTLLK